MNIVRGKIQLYRLVGLQCDRRQHLKHDILTHLHGSKVLIKTRFNSSSVF